ncbi:hypothetical protein [Pseudomonas sp. NFIX28]|jgi:hypothetical protein|uniref:hypothetical protein n=1 Tax=Pseudomonas sp. NFIX28 TaxID=1566235 RepID=UPI00089C45B8|nr:hypothetical protein [Pseudomonas sp. NFIX28]SDZ66109.1 hypothetical protein SAMN03159453_05672 [Pseudomonas sp. NFIX28]
MPDKRLRILIADASPEQGGRIERLLSGQGYFRVATVASFRELVTLTHYSYEPFENFDLLLLSGELAFAAGVDAGAFCLDNPQIRHAVIYGGRTEQALPMVLRASLQQEILWVRSATPETFLRFIAHINPSGSLHKKRGF